MEKIALGFSGGGLRAAAFSLGALSYLNEIKTSDGKPLLQKVRYIASTSGGSITNLYYSAAICHEHTFNQIYAELFRFMEGEKLVHEAIKLLKGNKYWKYKSRNLINAFALAYDNLLFKEWKSFSTYNRLTSDKIHLEEICANATEFTNGITFRFQSQPRLGKKGLIGNYYIYFNSEGIKTAEKIHISDILACSSCFPTGFEPFMFPKDFSHKDLPEKELSNAIHYSSNPFTTKINPDDPFADNEPDGCTPEQAAQADDHIFGLMDGGISDNQAIGSIKKAVERGKEFDLVILNDVTSYFINGYTVPGDYNCCLKKISLSQIFLLSFLLFPASIFAFFWSNHHWFSIGAIGFSIPLFLSLLKVLYSLFRSKKKQGTWTRIVKKYGAYFLCLPFDSLVPMIKMRLKSSALMASDIYLKQIRRLHYEQIYNDKRFKNKIISNVIYDLSSINQRLNTDRSKIREEWEKSQNDQTEFNTDASTDPLSHLEKIQHLADYALTMPTTLWFDENHQKNHARAVLIATGQFTTAYNLLGYLIKSKKAPDDDALISLLRSHWKQFIHDPFWLYNKEGENLKPGIKPLEVIKIGENEYKIVEKQSL